MCLERFVVLFQEIGPAIADTIVVELLQMPRQSVNVRAPIGLLAPCKFGEGLERGKEMLAQLGLVWNHFRPYTSLITLDILAHNTLESGLKSEVVEFLEQLVGGIGAKVEVAPLHENDGQSALGHLANLVGFPVSPEGIEQRLRVFLVESVVPCHGLFACAAHEVGHFLDKIVL